MKFEEIERLAFLKYKLSGKKSMNTFIFTQARINKLNNKEIDTLINNLDKKIKKYNEQENNKVKFTCNI